MQKLKHIKTTFSIKDLENLSGIKAHTIRIWEKRYGLLEPERTDTNIRFYSLQSLQKLLNISFLNTNGYKISKIAELDEMGFKTEIDKLVNSQVNKDDFLNNLKISMINYDIQLFEKTYQNVIAKLSFSEVFTDYFIPFLAEIGLLWQSGSINPTHEHFISNLIKQKILLEIHKLQLIAPIHDDKFFVMFLPDNEIHDIGLTFMHYQVLKKGYKSIMLGSSVPMDCLKPFVGKSEKVIFVSYFTIQPEIENVIPYLETFKTNVLNSSNAELYVLGKQVSDMIDENPKLKGIHLFSSLGSTISKI